MPVTGSRTAERLRGGGSPHLIAGAMITAGAGVIEGGIDRRAGNLVGDVACEPAAAVAAAIPPVPGSVIPILVAMCVRTTLHAFT